MTRVRLAALVALPLLLLGAAGCRETGARPADNGPGSSVDQQFNDVESTLDNIESELNAG